MAYSYEENKQFENSTSYVWRQTLYSYFHQQKKEVMYIDCLEGNRDVQNDHWDKLIVFRGSEGPKRIELKTIRQEKYYHYFIDYQKVLIEIIGNVEKHERTGDLGSSIFNSYADYWGYGFYVPSIDENIIIDPLIFFREDLANYLKPRVKKYVEKTAYTHDEYGNILYTTLNILVPLYEIERFIVNK